MKSYRLTQAQQQLASEHIGLVEKVIRFDIKQIIGNPDYSYDDLYQTGCVGLCNAAASFKDGSFPAYARSCIRNELYDYCREVNNHGNVQSLEAIAEKVLDGLLDTDCVVEEDVISMLLLSKIQEIKGDYAGITQKGIAAIELKLKGLSGADIAKMYGVEPNHISAWIARAKKRLLADARFLGAIA